MPTATTRLNLMQPVGPDPPSGLRVAITNNATTTDNAAIWLTGSLAARASISPLVAGTLYKGTDTGLLYHYDGTAWTTVMLAGAWVALSTMGLNVNLGSAAGGQYVPSARAEGDVIRFKGVLSATGAIAGGFVLWTMPLGSRPASIAEPGGTCVHSSALAPFTYSVATNGVVQGLSSGIASGDLLYLDGLTYSLT